MTILYISLCTCYYLPDSFDLIMNKLIIVHLLRRLYANSEEPRI